MLLASAPAAAREMNPVAGDPIAIDAGRIAGTLVDEEVKAYLGVPFAAAPVRENRWREPQPVKPWTGIYNADTKPPECVQGLRSSSINHYFGEETASEDCLYLNIWAPAKAKSGNKLPVVVWIYGGGFNGGSASSPIYSGVPLAKKGVIYVALNYRVGLFGFLAHPALTRESGHNASGNWGFLDQVAALKWVQRNIAAFGGDPANVTLVGQSAGAMSINNLQASPLARGLFARVFGMSGATVEGGAGEGVPLGRAEAEGVKLQEAMKAPDLAAMRAVSSDKVSAMAQAAGVRAGPDIDGYYLPDSTQAIFAAGRQFDVPVVAGATGNDIGTAIPIRRATTTAAYAEAAKAMYGDKAATFLKLWPARDDEAVVRQADQIGRSSGFNLGAYGWARLQTATGKRPAWLFSVSRVQPFTPGVAFADFNPATAGAYHMGEVPYFLGTYEAFNMFRTTRDWAPLDRDLSEKMQDVIVAFARTGDPSTAAVAMPRFNPRDVRRVDFGDTIRVERLNGEALAFLLANRPVASERPPSPPPGRTPAVPPSPTF
jgi:para-nitrobenzyl esterase